MTKQVVLDLVLMLTKEQWDINYNEVEVQQTMQEYFKRPYDLEEVREAIGIITNERLNEMNYV